MKSTSLKLNSWASSTSQAKCGSCKKFLGRISSLAVRLVLEVAQETSLVRIPSWDIDAKLSLHFLGSVLFEC